MNHYISITLLTLFTVFTGFSQQTEKIKGSRNVTAIVTPITTFERLVIGEDFEIKLLQGLTNSVQIETDDNLHEVIQFSVQDGSLSFNTTKRIRSSKKLDITVTFKDSLQYIEVKKDAELSALNDLTVPSLTLVTKESSRTALTIKTDLFKLINSDKSKVELNVTADKVTLELNDNSRTEALLNAPEITLDLYQRASARIDGDTENLVIRADNSITFRGEKLTANSTTLTNEGRAKVYIDTKNTLSLEASGYSETHIYGSPKIEIIKFEDQARLLKK
ncbi:GIN domain-containing protein [Bizionia paragorgiae]|uniref:GIN domain-containing protein n=1 Tax=Bizionia paragorgiae TaxID=283786 RepID=UPI00299ED4F0|nr:DUF2807 domain-containing protein [Bizionia paragorgiae]MDX1270583.1 DUF2807 domain-containing protein [Bizionia paragorgiae]